MPLADRDEWRLARFVEAQDHVYPRVVAELRAGRKQSHWMWFIFPQIAGLGLSAMSERYALCAKEEAGAYLNHLVLGPRLRECTELVLGTTLGTAIGEIFGYPDDLKFWSSMTLFAVAAPDEPLFRVALERFFAGERDPATIRLL